VSHVDPGSPVWRDGIRDGDRVLVLNDWLDPGGWRIDTIGETGPHKSAGFSHLDRLRRYVPWSVAALALVALAALLAFRGRPAAATVLPLALGIAAVPLFYAGNVVIGLVAGIAVFGGGALAIVAFARWRPWIVPVALAGAGLALCWVLASTVLPGLFDAVDGARAPGVLGLSLIGFVAVVDRQRLMAFFTGKGGPAFVDVAYLTTVAAIVIAAGILGPVPIEEVAILAVVAVAAYPFWRRSVISALERFVTSQARRDAAIRAVEDERGRLAREIHDAPLQELSGVIRRLESVPGAESEAIALRSVAEGLRNVATTLHPPVLQDLGLAAAIADLGDHVSEAQPSWKVVVDVDDVTLADRPPPDVELAAFRVIQEATANALAHSGGGCLEIGGLVAADTIELRATDDGHGFRDDDARQARRTGHFGLDAMRERAAAVGAKVLVTRGPPGASVQFLWERR
jgi:signal transduction histidine kinase